MKFLILIGISIASWISRHDDLAALLPPVGVGEKRAKAGKKVKAKITDETSVLKTVNITDSDKKKNGNADGQSRIVQAINFLYFLSLRIGRKSRALLGEFVSYWI